MHLLHGGIAARSTGTDKSRRARKDNECYEILKEAKTKNWTPMPETKAFMPVLAGESERLIGGEQARVMGQCKLLSETRAVTCFH